MIQSNSNQKDNKKLISKHVRYGLLHNKLKLNVKLY